MCGQLESTLHVVVGPIRAIRLSASKYPAAGSPLPWRCDDAGGPGGGIFVVGKLRRTHARTHARGEN